MSINHPPLPDVLERPEDDQILASTHELRKRVVSTLTKNGTEIPVSDPKQMTALLQTLDGMDRQALGNKRIKVDEAANKTAEQNAYMIASLLQQVTSKKPFEVMDAAARERREPPTLPADVPAPQLVEGETATAAPSQDYESFMAPNSPNG